MWPFNKKKYQAYFECEDWAIRKYAPIRPAREYVPKKFLDIPKFVQKKEHVIDSLKSVKPCPGIGDYFNLGYVIPAWCDIEIIPDDEGYMKTRYSDPQYKHDQHYSFQINNLLDQKFKVRSPIKLANPWYMYTAPNWKLLWLPMYYHDDTNWEAIPGIVDSDIGALLTPINIMLKKPKYTLIKQGEPLVQVVPIYNQNVIARTGDIRSSTTSRNKSILKLRNMSFNGWTKFMRKSKMFRIDANDLDLPG